MITSNSIKPLINKLFAVLICLLIAVTPSAQADWPFTRGGLTSAGVASTVLPADPQPTWKYTIEDSGFEGNPVCLGGVLYVGDVDGTVHAIKIDDGSLVWKKKFEETGFLCAGAVDNGRFFLGDFEGIVRALSTENGEELWQFQAESELYAGPIVYEDLLLITTESGGCLALDKTTGEEKWAFRIEAPLRCAPSIFQGHVMLSGCDSKLHVVNIANGESAGSTELGSQTGCTAAIQNKKAFFGTEEGRFVAIDLSDITAPKQAWDYRDPKRGQGIRIAAAVDAGHAVYSNQGKGIYCLNPTDGELIWDSRSRSRIESSPVIIGDRVAILTTRGRAQLLSLVDGEVVWEYEAGGSYLASPLAMDGKLILLNTDGTIQCFGESDEDSTNKQPSEKK